MIQFLLLLLTFTTSQKDSKPKMFFSFHQKSTFTQDALNQQQK